MWSSDRKPLTTWSFCSDKVSMSSSVGNCHSLCRSVGLKQEYTRVLGWGIRWCYRWEQQYWIDWSIGSFNVLGFIGCPPEPPTSYVDIEIGCVLSVPKLVSKVQTPLDPWRFGLAKNACMHIFLRPGNFLHTGIFLSKRGSDPGDDIFTFGWFYRLKWCRVAPKDVSVNGGVIRSVDVTVCQI